MKNPKEKLALTTKAREWGMKQDFKNLALEWEQKLFCL